MKSKIKFPSPILIFILLWLITIFLSFLFRNIEFSVNSTEYTVINLLNKSGIDYVLSNFVNNLSNFPVLPMILVVTIGVGLAEETNFLHTLIKISIIKIPRYLITPLLLFIGILGNLAGSVSFAIVPTLGGIIYKEIKRNPILGVITGFIGVSGGLSANLFIAPTDILSSSITQTAAQIVDKNYIVYPTANWYFFAISVFTLTIVGTFVIEIIVSRMLKKYEIFENENEEKENYEVSLEEKNALKYSLYGLFIYIFVLLIFLIPKNSILRSDDGKIIGSVFLNGMIFFITLLFLIPSLIYGILTKKIKEFDDIIKLIEKSISKYSNFILICIFASQFIAVFSKTNLGLYFTYKLTNLIVKLNFNIYLFLILFIILISVINLFIGSLSAKWIVLSPIVVPLFMNLGFTPEFAQLAFRIADSSTNSISPLEPFMPFILACMIKYNKNIKLNDLIKLMFPLSISFLIIWIIQMFIFIFFNLSIGPNAHIYL